MIKLEHITKSYDGFDALSEINLSIQPGEIFGIFGKSGAGKSTLLRCMNLLEPPTSGTVTINAVELTKLGKLDLRATRHKIGMIFQHFNLLESRTAFDNIALPLEIQHKPKADLQTKVHELLRLVDLVDRQDHYPSKLSGGQKQRVAIARALATDPNVLLCDEATSALDPESTENILQLLKTINQKLGLTIVLITHELDVLKKICHRAGVLDNGQLVEVGTTVELFSSPKHPVTQTIISKSLPVALPPNPDLLTVRLTFVGEASRTPLITTLIRDYQVSVNILQADISDINQVTVGHTLCEIDGEPDAVRQALDYLNASQINVEVIHHG